MSLQIKLFSEVYSSLLVLTATILIYNVYIFITTPHYGIFSKVLNFKNIEKPFLNIKINFFVLCLTGSTIIVIFSLGKNAGNWMTYLFQLMSPFLLIWGFSTIRKSQLKPLFYLPFVFVLFYQVYAILPDSNLGDTKNWEKVNILVKDNETILASPILTSLLIQNNKPLLHNG